MYVQVVFCDSCILRFKNCKKYRVFIYNEVFVEHCFTFPERHKLLVNNFFKTEKTREYHCTPYIYIYYVTFLCYAPFLYIIKTSVIRFNKNIKYIYRTTSIPKVSALRIFCVVLNLSQSVHVLQLYQYNINIIST